MDQQPAGSGTELPRDEHVFLSYSREDQKTAKAVISLLERLGYKVWWDGLIPGGERFGKVTGEALENARAVMVLWSKVSVESHWVHDEATRGRDSGRLVPLSIDGSHPPLGFGQFQFIDVSKEGIRQDGPQMQRALAALAALYGEPAPVLPQARAAGPVSRRTLIAGSAAAVVIAGGAAGWRFLRGGAPGNSLAVLPFDNIGGDPSQQYLPDGLAAELRSRFARNPLLTVAGQTSSNEFRSNTGDAKGIAARLGVAHLLTGSVRMVPGEVRIAVELVEATTGYSKWTQTYQRPLDNILRLQEEIAEAVDAALTPQLAADSHRESVKRSGGTKIAAAYDAYLRGKQLFANPVDDGSDLAALAEFTRAADLDPAYAAAHAARARTMGVIGVNSQDLAVRHKMVADAESEARRAIELAAEYPEGHVALAYATLFGKLDVIGAEPAHEAAMRFGAGNAEVLSRYALYYARRRQPDKALPAIDKAAMLEPLDAALFKSKSQVHYACAEWDAAIAAGRKALEINPKVSSARGNIGNALLQQGKMAEAEAEFAAEKNITLALPGKAIVALRQGNQAAAKAAYDQLVTETGKATLYQQAQVLSQWDKREEALTALEGAYHERDPGLLLAYSDPFLKPLEAEARFKTLLGTLHFV
ncbi:MAG: TIR domain-containing protein [Novosphingobium sp.]